MRKNRRWLYGVLAVGLISLGAGAGTFATFNATTTNAGNTFTTGSLYLSNTVGEGTACFSYNGTNNNNTSPNGPGCSTVVTTSQLYPGAPIVTGTVKVANVGTIDASTLNLYSTGCTDSDVTVTVPNVTVSGSGATTITTSGATWVSLGVGANMTLTDTAGDLPSSGNTVLSISGTTLTMALAATGGPTSTDTVQFVSQTSTSGNPLCGAVVAYVEETAQTTTAGVSNAYTYCWYGDGSGGATCDVTTGDLNALPADTDNLATLASYTSGNPLALSALTASGTTGAGKELPAGSSRTFTIGLYLPDTSGSQNNLMDLQSNFGLTWTIAQ